MRQFRHPNLRNALYRWEERKARDALSVRNKVVTARGYYAAFGGCDVLDYDPTQ